MIEDGIKFSSGRAIYANRGIVGIAPDLELSEGYDGGITWPIPDWWKERGWTDSNTLTREDMLELADIMLDRWKKFKESL